MVVRYAKFIPQSVCSIPNHKIALTIVSLVLYYKKINLGAAARGCLISIISGGPFLSVLRSEIRDGITVELPGKLITQLRLVNKQSFKMALPGRHKLERWS